MIIEKKSRQYWITVRTDFSVNLYTSSFRRRLEVFPVIQVGHDLLHNVLVQFEQKYILQKLVCHVGTVAC